MNWPALVAGVLALLAFLAHAIAGGAELRHVAPADASAKAAEVRLQIINGWHWVSLDLLLAAVSFTLIGVADNIIPHERVFLGGLVIYFAATGTVWLITTAITSRLRVKTMLRLAQWLLCYVLAALAWAAR
jgi:hypothetical protein